MNRKAVFAIEPLGTNLTIINKLPREVNGFNVIFYVGLVLIGFATTATHKQSCFGIPFNVFFKHNSIRC